MGFLRKSNITMKNLILGAIYKYGWKDIAPFVLTAQKNVPDAEIVLLYSGLTQEKIDEIASHGVILRKMAYRDSGVLNSWMRFWPILKWIRFLPTPFAKKIQNRLLPFAWSRYFGYYDLLTQETEKYEYVFLTDVRDVIFQDNPFTKDLASGLNVYLEEGNRTIESCEMNRQWISEIIPSRVAVKILPNEVCCCGTVLGDTKSILAYLKQYIRYSLNVEKLLHGGDTAIHDWIVYATPKIKKQIWKNGKGAVATLNTPQFIDVNLIDNTIRNTKSETIPIVHQYDRIASLNSFYISLHQ